MAPSPRYPLSLELDLDNLASAWTLGTSGVYGRLIIWKTWTQTLELVSFSKAF